MAEKTKLSMRIFGKEYTLVGPQPEEYIHKVGSYVDKKMNEVARLNEHMSTQMIAVLTALNIADDFLTNKQDMEQIEKENRHLREELEKSSRELMQLKADYLNLQSKNEGLTNALLKKDPDIERSPNSPNKAELSGSFPAEKIYNLEKRSRSGRM